MRMRKKKNLNPRMERCAALLIQDPYQRQGRWRELMPKAREVHVELGCGKGRFTAGTAAAEPDVLLIAVEVVPDAMVVAMERCERAGLSNVFFVDANADQLPSFFAPGEVDRIYLNFSDPWPSKRHAKRRLTHGSFLKLYREVLRPGGQIHFKTDNQGLFDFSLEELPRYGFALSEVTKNLHEQGPVGVMTDYEAKFYEEGLPICRLVGTMEPWEEPFPTEAREARRRWVEAFGAEAEEGALRERVLSAPGRRNHLWNLFSENLVPALSGEEARAALAQKAGLTRYRFTEEAILPPSEEEPGPGEFLVDREFTWTYVQPPEGVPYFKERV